MSKVIFLTGVSKGLGFEVAKILLLNGHSVVGTVLLSSPFMEELQVQYPLTFTPIFMDAASDDSVRSAVEVALKKYQKFDVLINSAGIFLYGSLEVCSTTEIQDLFNVNLFGVIRVIQNFLPHFKKQRHGTIINVSSLSGYEPVPFAEIYCSAKAALESLTESLACTLLSYNVHVILLCVSGLRTTMPITAKIGSRAIPGNESARKQAQKAKARSKTYYQNKADPKEIALEIVKMIDKGTNNFRALFGKPAIDCAKKRFIDPTGNTHIKDKVNYLKLADLL